MENKLKQMGKKHWNIAGFSEGDTKWVMHLYGQRIE